MFSPSRTDRVKADWPSELIHTFDHPVPAAPSAVTCMVQSPAIDVIGVGYLDGHVHLLDLRQGELVMQMKMEDGSVSSLSFRTGKRHGSLRHSATCH